MRRLDDYTTTAIEDPTNQRRHDPSHGILCDPEMTLVNYASMQLSECLITDAWSPIGCDWRSAVAAKLQKSDTDCGKDKESPNDKGKTWKREDELSYANKLCN